MSDECKCEVVGKFDAIDTTKCEAGVATFCYQCRKLFVLLEKENHAAPYWAVFDLNPLVNTVVLDKWKPKP